MTRYDAAMIRPKQIALIAACVAALLAGCAAPSPAAKSATNPEPDGTETKLYEQLRGGVFNIELALDAFTKARDELKAARPGMNAAASASADDLLDMLNSAASLAADDAAEPTLAAAKANYAGEDERRLGLVGKLNDALKELSDAPAVLQDIRDAAPAVDAEPVANALGEAEEALHEAITALGGTVDE
jgi:hypothetical protein